MWSHIFTHINSPILLHKMLSKQRVLNCPTLLLYGEQDKNVSRKETDEIYYNLNGPKTLIIFKNAGHENNLIKYRKEWIEHISAFLNQ